MELTVLVNKMSAAEKKIVSGSALVREKQGNSEVRHDPLDPTSINFGSACLI